MARPRKAGFFIEAEALGHWRFQVAGAAGTGLWAFACTWCDENLTDGHVRADVARALLPNARAAMERVTRSGLWTECVEHETCFVLHRYTEDGRHRPRQPTRAQVEARSQSERSRKRVENRGVSVTIPAGNVTETPGLDTPLLSVVPPLSPPQGEPQPEAAPTTPAASRARLLPKSWQPTEAHASYAAAHRLDLEAEVDKFRGHHALKGTLGKDWDAGFRVWLRKAVEFRDERGGARPAPKGERPMVKFE